MRTIIFEEQGKKKIIERALTVNCLLCDVSLSCPLDADFWAWLKSPEVVAFFDEHRVHGASNTVGAQITVVEKDFVDP